MLHVIMCAVTTVILRFLPHLPNCTPMNACALMFGRSLSPAVATLCILALSLGGDLAFGWHWTAMYVYASYAVMVMLGRSIRGSRSWCTGMGVGVLGSLIFFVITNFGVWAHGGCYPLTLSGLMSCYVAGIPFFGWSLGTDCIFLAIFYAVEKFVRQLRSAQPMPLKAMVVSKH